MHLWLLSEICQNDSSVTHGIDRQCWEFHISTAVLSSLVLPFLHLFWSIRWLWASHQVDHCFGLGYAEACRSP